MSERGPRVKLLTNTRYNLYKVTHLGREPWDRLRAKTEHYTKVGTASRCKVCGLTRYEQHYPRSERYEPCHADKRAAPGRALRPGYRHHHHSHEKERYRHPV